MAQDDDQVSGRYVTDENGLRRWVADDYELPDNWSEEDNAKSEPQEQPATRSMASE